MPVEVFNLSTREPEVAMAALSAQYRPERPFTFSWVTGSSSFNLRLASTGDLGVGQARFAMGMQAVMAPVDYFLVATGTAGGARYAVGREEVNLRPGGMFLYPTTATMTSRFQDLSAATVQLPMPVLERVAAERFDVSAADLRFDGLVPVSEAARRSWLHLTRYVQAQLGDPASAAGEPLVATTLVDLVAATALTTFANTTMTREPVSGPGWVAPVMVRRAVAFIEANAASPITVSDIARAAGVGPRALQLAFTRHLQTTPMAHLRRVRLEAAHRELAAGNTAAGDTVTVIARRWGFAKPARFAADYHQQYGTSPSHTLRT